MISVSEPLIGEAELRNVEECIRTGWISSSGPFIEEFERLWGDYCGMTHGIAVANGTVALQVAVGCLDLQPGDEVIMPTFTIISCALAVIYNGGVPVLVDSDPHTWCMDVSRIEEKITPRTRAIMPVHIYGHPVDMDPLRALAEKHGLVVIEDAAEAHGATYKGRICGSLGDISCFSFYANKIITTGEGGMVLTNDSVYADKARSLRNLCFRAERRFYHTELGHNFRLTNLQAAIGVAQMSRIEEAVRRKRAMAATYAAGLANIPSLTLPPEEPWAQSVYWMYGILVDERSGLDATAVAAALRARGVETRPFFLGMHEQPVLRERNIGGGTYPVADRLARQGLYLPSGLTLTEMEMHGVCDAVRAVLD